MTVVNPKSISGINSITTGSGSDNLLTIHTSDASNTERVRINSSGDVIVGSGITVSPDGDVFTTGVTTSTTFSGNFSGGTVSGTTGTFTGNVDIAANVRHIDDTDTYISFSSDNQIEMFVADQQAIKFTTTSIETGDNKRIDIIDAAGDRSGEIKNSDSGANSLMISADPDNSGSSSVMQFAIDGSEKARFDSSGRLLLGTGAVSLPKGTGGGSFDLDGGSITMCVGGNINSTGRTNSTDKINRITSPHYTNAEEPVALVSSYNVSGNNTIFYGGGSSTTNAVTRHIFYTAADTTTTTGTERLRIDSSGNLLVGGTSLGAAGSFGMEQDGHVRSILASGDTGDTLFGAISGVSNGFQVNISRY